MTINIDNQAGFCSGVKRAIRLAEEELKNGNELFCLGQIIHNEAEIERLERLGMKTIDRGQFEKLSNTTVLIRAHGEPPETYKMAEINNIRLIDGTCPTVLKLQAKVRKCLERNPNIQIAIFGRRKHPEVIGLNGQTGNKAIIVEGFEDIKKLDFTRPVCLFAQTTQNKSDYQRLIDAIKSQKLKIIQGDELHFTATESICAQVSGREQNLRKFAQENDVVLFAGGDNSSNGKYLFAICCQENAASHYISNPEMIVSAWFSNVQKIGITGATSTPQWQLDEIARRTRIIVQSNFP